MSSNEKFKSSKFDRTSERLTLFSICCPCLRPKKLTCRASDIALVMYDKDEPHEYVLEKLVVKRIPLRFFGVDEDFEEYERSLKGLSNTSCEEEVAIANLEDEQSRRISEAQERKPKEEIKRSSLKEIQTEKTEVLEEATQILSEATSCNSLGVNCHTPVNKFLESKLSFACEPLTEPKSGDELILRTITADDQDALVTEVDQRIAKMSPDLEQTINVLKAVKPRPVSTQGTPMPIKNQRRLSSRNIENEGILTKDGYNYKPCPNDHPLSGIHYTLNKTTFAPAVEEISKSIITDFPAESTLAPLSRTQTAGMIEEGTTNYEDATVLAVDDTSIYPSMFNVPTLRNLSDEEDYIRSDYSSDSTTCIPSMSPRRLKNWLNPPHKRNDVGNTDFSVYHAHVARCGRKMPPPKCSKKRNLKWKIVINNHSRELKVPPASSNSEFQFLNNKKNSSKNFILRSGISY